MAGGIVPWLIVGHRTFDGKEPPIVVGDDEEERRRRIGVSRGWVSDNSQVGCGHSASMRPKLGKASCRFRPCLIQRALEQRQVEPLINWISWQLHSWHPLNLGRERERRLDSTDAVATRYHRSEPECEVNPFPLIEVTVQLAERGQCIRQAFEVPGVVAAAIAV